MICYLYDAPTFLFYAADIPSLLYYSHVPTTIAALLIGFIVMIHNPKKLLNQLLFGLTLCFSLWTFASLTAWTSINADYLAFIWPLFAISSALLSILSIYLALVFYRNGDISFLEKIALLTLITPVLLFAHTNLNFSGFDLTSCDAFAYENFGFKLYYTLIGLIAIVWIAIAAIKAYQKSKSPVTKNKILLFTTGIEFFLILFISTTFLFSYLVNIGILVDSRLEMYGLFGMTFFVGILSILIVRFKTFNTGIAAPIALVATLILVTASQFTYVESRAGFSVTAVTLLLSGFVALILLRSVKNELKQRTELEKLTFDLEKANVRLKALDKQKSEFVSIASHQLRSPLTAIRGYASLLLEGSFGTIPQKAKEPLERIDESSKLMAFAIEDYLNVSRIESGNMKYNLSDFNLPNEVEHITDDLRADALKHGLVLYFKKSLHSQGVINADIGKVVQIIHNLINNSIKYTQKGTITVLVRDDMSKKKIFVDIIDTGIGMNQETLHTIFQKFERAKNANSVNTSGTGLGLFVADKMAEAMSGDISAHSDGDGKGSRFTLEMPLAM